MRSSHRRRVPIRDAERCRALYEIGFALSSSLDLSTVLERLLERIDSLLSCEAAITIWLLGREGGLLEPVAGRNLNHKGWKAELANGGRGLPNAVLQTRAPLVVRDLPSDPRLADRDFCLRQGLRSYLGIPLIAGDEPRGVLAIYAKEAHDFSDEMEFLSDIARQGAAAIHHAQLYEDMARLATDLAKANRMKDDFLGFVSHELRAPLNVVMGYVGMIKDGMFGPINAQQERALEKVMGCARDQLNVITSLLQASQLEAGEIRLEHRDIDLGGFLEELRSAYELPLNKGVKLVWDYPRDLPVIRSDGEKLKHALRNIVNNAIKFTEKGSVTFSVRIVEGESPSVEFKVSDTGIGIPKEMLPVIFEKFRRVDTQRAKLYGGIGLGLYIVKNFVDLLGGEIEVESEMGKGSIFTVRLPCAAGRTGPPGSMAGEERRSRQGHSQ